MTDGFIILLYLFSGIKPNYRIKMELGSEFCYTKNKHGTFKAQIRHTNFSVCPSKEKWSKILR
ncbi:hypothetical protein B5J92_08430 [Moraxella atlantae]|nr:hypothetical protein B5J92_08430 [Moraxella atlantae]